MAVKLSVAVMHAPWAVERRPHVDAIVAACTHVQVIQDDERQGVWKTAKRAWTSHPPDATHHMVIQDDVELCDDFEKQVLAGLAVKSDVPTSYLSTAVAKTAAALARGSSWLPLHGHFGGQAQCLPVGMIQPWLDWCAASVAEDYKDDDVRLALYLLHLGVPHWYTVPSLVQHRGDHTSLLGHKVPFSQRVHFVKSPGPVDWTRGADDPPIKVTSFSALVKRYVKHHYKAQETP